MAAPRVRKTSVVPRHQTPLGKLILRRFARSLVALTLLGFIALFAFMGYKRLSQNAFFPLKRVVLTRQLIYADPQLINNAVQNYGRADLLQVDVADLAKDIRSLDWVQSATVEKLWPDAVKVDVVERIPILRWGNDDFLDNDGNHFHLPETPPLAALFPVKGPEGTEEQVLAMYRKVTPWLNSQQIPITALTLDPRMNWHVGIGSIDVIVGRDNLNERFKKLVPVYNRIIKKYDKYIDSVDLRYQDGFSVRWKDGVTPAGGEDGINTAKAEKQ